MAIVFVKTSGEENMGGYGSGRLGSKPKSEEVFKIDVRQMKRNGSLQSGATSTNRWTRGDVLLAEISMTSWMNQVIIHTSPEQKVNLTWTSCNYGGQRPWFLCPSCNRRSAILYITSASLACSTCQNITYYCRSEGQIDRMLRKKNKLRKRLIVDDGWGLDFFCRPKGMHQKTYDRLLSEFFDAEEQINCQIESQFGACF